MAQLKMYFIPGTPVVEEKLPEGYSFSNYKCEDDRVAWHHICLDGLTKENDEEGAWYRAIEARADIDPYKDMFFLDYNGEHIGTITAYVHKKENIGDVHMVSIRTDFRGKGLSKYLTQKALSKLQNEADLRYIFLTTDEFRVSAVKGYLNAGFLPVEYDYGMVERWENVLETYGIDSVQMLYNDATPYKTIRRKGLAEHKKVKFGVVGAGRGKTMMDYCMNSNNAELYAVCDNYEPALNKLREKYGDGIRYFSDYDEMLKTDIDCVVLANYANEHAPFAIKAMKAGKHVLSEVLPVQTMKEAVELIETVESTGKIYAYAENYCFMGAPKKMRKLFKSGKLGNFEYGEGEYMHNCESIWYDIVHGDEEHWRNNMSAFYYCTHSIGPILHITGLRPVSVTGFEAPINERMTRMGAKAGPFGVEMITLENGGIVKSLHGVGPSRNSVWYSVYGSKGRAESAREDAGVGATHVLYGSFDEREGDNDNYCSTVSTKDGLTERAEATGHGGSDYYVMYNMAEAILGNKQAEIVDVYEAIDMFLPGMFAYRSVRAGGVPVEIPDLRDKNVRDMWRNDTECTDKKVAGDMYTESYSKGNPYVAPGTYEILKERQKEASADRRARAEIRKKYYGK